MKYVIGIDLGTSAVKVLMVNANGQICAEVSREYPLHQERAGYSEQAPEDWVRETINALAQLVKQSGVMAQDIEGISFSGQMHGLVLLDREHKPLRPAILWNDTRTTKQCREIEAVLGHSLLEITRNPALEGFTLPKILWVREHEPERYAQADVFLLPKDYVRYRLTGEVHMEFSDAAGTLLLDVRGTSWSTEICNKLGINPSICPPLVEPLAFVGTLLPSIAEATGLSVHTKVFAGGADNACGAVGAGILSADAALCSIGTSGVILAYEENQDRDYSGKVHFFNHAATDAYYAMGVTLSAGHSLSWFRDTFAPSQSFQELLTPVEQVPIGSKGLLYTPYLMGERTPHADSIIRGSFIGIDGAHDLSVFARAVMEGITMSLYESVQLFRSAGQSVNRVISIGGGAKNSDWLQMQADVFQTEVITLHNEQGPGMGAAMIAAVGSGWFDNLANCAKQFIKYGDRFEPVIEHVQKYHELYELYRSVYEQTRQLNERLQSFRI
jgi:xylulokinase